MENKTSTKHENGNDANRLLWAVSNTKIKLKGSKNNKAFSRGLHKIYKDLIWVELHCKYGDKWFFNKVELMSISEVELT